MLVLAHVAQAITQHHALLRVEQIATGNLHTQAVVEKCLGQAQVEVTNGSGERHVLHVALGGDIEVGIRCESGQNLDVIVKLYHDNRALGADKANWCGNLGPVFNHAQRELWLVDAKLGVEVEHQVHLVTVVEVLAGEQGCGLAAGHLVLPEYALCSGAQDDSGRAAHGHCQRLQSWLYAQRRYEVCRFARLHQDASATRRGAQCSHHQRCSRHGVEQGLWFDCTGQGCQLLCHAAYPLDRLHPLRLHYAHHSALLLSDKNFRARMRTRGGLILRNHTAHKKSGLESSQIPALLAKFVL